MHCFDADLFWQYSIDLYRDESVATLCLKLQNTEGLNVNVLLLCDFLSSLGYLASVDTFKQIHDNNEFSHWNSAVTAKLRSSRQAISKDEKNKRQADLRHSILSAELQAEQIEQQLIIAALNNCESSAKSTNTARSGDNIINYWQAQTKKAASGDLLALIQQLK